MYICDWVPDRALTAWTLAELTTPRVRPNGHLRVYPSRGTVPDDPTQGILFPEQIDSRDRMTLAVFSWRLTS